MENLLKIDLQHIPIKTYNDLTLPIHNSQDE